MKTFNVNPAYFRSTTANRQQMLVDCIDHSGQVDQASLYAAYSAALPRIDSDKATLALALMVCRIPASTIGRIVEGAKDKEAAAKRLIAFATAATKVAVYATISELLSVAELEASSEAASEAGSEG